MSNDLHGIQIVLSQIPRIQKLSEHQDHLIPNGNQIINVTQEAKHNRSVEHVDQLEEPYRSEAEDPDKRRIKKKAQDQKRRGKRKKKKGLIDLYG